MFFETSQNTTYTFNNCLTLLTKVTSFSLLRRPLPHLLPLLPLHKQKKTCTIFRRTNSNNLLMSKAQSTIFICALLVFITLLLFILSTFEPTTKPHPLITTASKRFLSQKSPPTTNTDPKLLNKPIT